MVGRARRSAERGAALTRDLLAFARAGIHIEWRGSGFDEKGYERGSDRVLVEIDPRYLRPTEVDLLLGDASKAKAKLGWVPATSFEELVNLMVDSDLDLVANEALLRKRP